MGAACRLEAFPVNDGGARLVILLLGDPHLLEGGEGSKNVFSNTNRVLPLYWSNDLHLDGGWSKGTSCKRASRQRNRSIPMVMTWLSKSSYEFSRDVEAAAVDIHILLKVKADILELLLDVKVVKE